LVLKLDEFMISIIENKTKIKCENLIKKPDYKNIKKYQKELLKKVRGLWEYINRYMNAIKNMSLIISS